MACTRAPHGKSNVEASMVQAIGETSTSRSRGDSESDQKRLVPIPSRSPLASRMARCSARRPWASTKMAAQMAACTACVTRRSASRSEKTSALTTAETAIGAKLSAAAQRSRRSVTCRRSAAWASASGPDILVTLVTFQVTARAHAARESVVGSVPSKPNAAPGRGAARPWRMGRDAPSRVSANRRALPIVVGRAACFVHLPEGELDRQVERHLLRMHVGHLQIEAGALDVDDAGDQRRARATREVVEGEGADRADLVGEADRVEVVLGVAGEADALEGILRRPAAAALLAEQAQVRVAVAEVLGRGEARAGATVVLGAEELAEAEGEIVARELGASVEVPGGAASAFEALGHGARLEEEGVGAVAVAHDQHSITRLRPRERGREEERREGGARVPHPTEEGILHLGGREAELAHHPRVAARVRAVEHDARQVLRGDAALREESLHDLAHVVAATVVDDEAILPGGH